jgi:TonB family protein
LLTQAIGGRPVITSNFFSVKSIQKRFKMITKNRKGKLSFLKYSLGVFIALAITLIFACENKTDKVLSDPPVKTEVVTKDQPEIQSEVVNPDEEVPFIIVEQQATFQGGDLNAFRDWVQNHLEYPAVAASNGISGKVYVQFAITSKGDVVDIKVLRGVDPSLDNESVRVIKSSPKWTPAQQGGKNVKQQFVIPIQFSLQ